MKSSLFITSGDAKKSSWDEATVDRVAGGQLDPGPTSQRSLTVLCGCSGVIVVCLGWNSFQEHVSHNHSSGPPWIEISYTEWHTVWAAIFNNLYTPPLMFCSLATYTTYSLCTPSPSNIIQSCTNTLRMGTKYTAVRRSH